MKATVKAIQGRVGQPEGRMRASRPRARVARPGGHEALVAGAGRVPSPVALCVSGLWPHCDVWVRTSATLVNLPPLSKRAARPPPGSTERLQ